MFLYDFFLPLPSTQTGGICKPLTVLFQFRSHLSPNISDSSCFATEQRDEQRLEIVPSPCTDHAGESNSIRIRSRDEESPNEHSKPADYRLLTHDSSCLREIWRITIYPPCDETNTHLFPRELSCYKIRLRAQLHATHVWAGFPRIQTCIHTYIFLFLYIFGAKLVIKLYPDVLNQWAISQMTFLAKLVIKLDPGCQNQWTIAQMTLRPLCCLLSCRSGSMLKYTWIFL